MKLMCPKHFSCAYLHQKNTKTPKTLRSYFNTFGSSYKDVCHYFSSLFFFLKVFTDTRCATCETGYAYPADASAIAPYLFVTHVAQSFASIMLFILFSFFLSYHCIFVFDLWDLISLWYYQPSLYWSIQF